MVNQPAAATVLDQRFSKILNRFPKLTLNVLLNYQPKMDSANRTEILFRNKEQSLFLSMALKSLLLTNGSSSVKVTSAILVDPEPSCMSSSEKSG